MARMNPGKGRNQLLIVHNVIKIKCILTLPQHYTEQHAGRIKEAIQLFQSGVSIFSTGLYS